jgi:hypothetical protein
MKLSVLLCTRNPRPDYLRRVLAALRAQDLPKAQWELLLLDNASEKRLADIWDLSWHPHARHLREAQLGKTAVMLSGIHQAQGHVLVIVDDDNILARNYLTTALEKMATHPQVGVWSGTNRPEFEVHPTPWKRAFMPYLAINFETADRISSDLESAPLPIGAGMVLRREVAQEYWRWMAAVAPKRKVALSRCGTGLFAGEEDTEVGIVAIKNGFACGRTPSLQLTHLMPSHRLAASYLFRIVRDISYSHSLIFHQHGLQRGHFTMREFISQTARCLGLIAVGLVGGNADRLGRGLVGLATLCGIGRARRSRPF